MKNSLRYIPLSILFMHFLLFSTAFAYKKAKCFVLVAPQQILPGVERIAVLDFEGEGNYGKSFSGHLISRLIEVDRGIHDIRTGFLGMGGSEEGQTLQEGTFTNVFDIVERSQMMKIIEEQQLGMSGLLDQNQAVSLGKMLGVQAIIMGDVITNKKVDNFRESRTYKKDGKKYTRKVNCRKRGVHTTVKTRIISTESGQILGSTEASRSMEDKKCGKQINQLASMEQMVEATLSGLSSEIANYFSPHYELQEYELEKIKTDQFEEPGEKAAEQVEDLEIDKAYVYYKSIYEKDSYNPKILYNLGILHEIVGNFNKANQFYQMAYQLKDEGKYQDAIARVQKNGEFSEALAKMGIQIREHSFEVSEKDLAKATAKKVEIKGDREERFNIYAQPQQGSEVIARVPGEVTFTVVERDGEWYLIELLGGEQGYIHNDQVEIKD